MLRIFGKLKNVCLEVYGSDDNKVIAQKYASLTGESIENQVGFIDRKGKNWKNQFRVYFDAEPWVIESLNKLGLSVLDKKTPNSIIVGIFGKEDGDCKYIINNGYWFWKIVEYGYKVGANDTISWEEHQEKRGLKIKT